MNELELKLVGDASEKDQIKLFINELTANHKKQSVVKITALDEKHISMKEIGELFSEYTCIWHVDKSIEVDDALVTHLNLSTEIPVSLVITTNGQDYIMIKKDSVSGFIGERGPAASAANVANHIQRLSR